MTKTKDSWVVGVDLGGTKIAAGLPQGIEFAHKSGAIANCQTAAGMIYTSAGPVAICFLSNKNEDQSWYDDNEANAMERSNHV